MIKIINDFEHGIDLTDSNRFLDIECEQLWDRNAKLEYFKLLDKVSREAKSKLISKIGGLKTYAICEYENKFEYFSAINELREHLRPFIHFELPNGTYIVTAYALMENECEDFLTSYSAYLDNRMNKEIYLEHLKAKYSYIEYFNKLRDVPKITRMFTNLVNGLLEIFKLKLDTSERLIAKINDMLLPKTTKYIVELSCDVRDIMTASVSDNFTSCFDIKRSACNCASVNYLACDNRTMVLKLYEYNDKNISDMEKGIMDYHNAVSRCFISFDTDTNRMVSGRRYPDDRYLPFKITIEQNIFDYLTKTKNELSCYENIYVSYGKSYRGYKDYNESRTLCICLNGDKNITKYFVRVGSNGCVYWNSCNSRFEHGFMALASNSLYSEYSDEDCDDNEDDEEDY